MKREYFPFVMIQFVVMAAVNPKWASICFSIWITARFFYATGPSLKSWSLIRMTHTIRQARTKAVTQVGYES